MDGRATETTPLTNAQARGKLEPSWTPELIAGMIQRAGKRAPRVTSRSVLRSMGQETWRTILCQRPNHSFPIQQCGRHLRVRNPPILQKSKRTYHSPGGRVSYGSPFGHFTASNTFSVDSCLLERLQRGLLWDPSVSPYEVQTPGQLLLYTGKKDSQSLDSVLLGLQSSLEGHIIALDIRRSEDHDILRGDLYSRLCVSAWTGYIQGTGGTAELGAYFGGSQNLDFPNLSGVDKNQTVGDSQSSKPQRPKTRTMTACSYLDSCSYATSPS